MSANDEGFLVRWSRRKVALRGGKAVARDVTPAPSRGDVAPRIGDVTPSVGEVTPGVGTTAPRVDDALSSAPAATLPAPTLADVEALASDAADFSRFVAAGVDENVKRAALKKLFADPHFNVMDGLDTYIDDYGKPDPLPRALLVQLAQARSLGLAEAERAPESRTHGRPPSDAAKANPDGAGEVPLARSAACVDAGSAAALGESAQPDAADGSAGSIEGDASGRRVALGDASVDASGDPLGNSDVSRSFSDSRLDEDPALRLQPDDAARPGGAPDRARS